MLLGLTELKRNQGLERVLQVDAIGQADLLIAVKDTAGGKHQNLTQGERSAKNLGISFVVVGSRMTKDSLQKALNPFLNEITPAEAAAREAALAKEAERKAFADAFFSSAATAKFSGAPLPAAAAAAAGGSMGRLQQLQQQQARISKTSGAAAAAGGGGSSSSSSSSRAVGGAPGSRGNRGPA
ncbi:hypothetical protein OEZ86_008896 [Tetradesmus obliquus]|nr:hypothetical protein OEZ86_008896 [Tetradesmus obliquus]